MFKLNKFQPIKYSKTFVIKTFLWEIFSITIFRSKISIINNGTKSWILKNFGASLGKNLVIRRGVHIKFPWNLEIGDNVWIGEKVWIDNFSKVSIGSNVCISQGVKICSGNHNFKKDNFESIDSPITIRSNVWIGCFAIILPGSIINHNQLIVGGGTFPTNYESKVIK